MITASLAAFINAQAELNSAAEVGLGITAYEKTEDSVLGEVKAPMALVSMLAENPQELWVIGDSQRKENPVVRVAFYCVSAEQRRQAEARFRRLIGAATATDVNSLTHPGIDFKAFADRLRDSGDHLTYYSNQPSWFTSPTPVVYKNEGSNGEPTVVASGYSVNSTAGSVTFSVANAASDKIRATYKIGVIDFNILGVARFETAQDADVANNPARYVAAFTLETHFYIKTNANRYL